MPRLFQKIKLDTALNVPGSKRFDVNVRAVLGIMATGNDSSHLDEPMATFNSPSLS